MSDPKKEDYSLFIPHLDNIFNFEFRHYMSILEYHVFLQSYDTYRKAIKKNIHDKPNSRLQKYRRTYKGRRWPAQDSGG